jgi:hypothetical protein
MFEVYENPKAPNRFSTGPLADTIAERTRRYCR